MLLLDIVQCVQNCTDFKTQKYLITAARRELEAVIANARLGPDEAMYHKSALTTEEVEIGRTEGKIPCIKAVRARLGCNLKEAKDLVEDCFNYYCLVFYTSYTPICNEV